MHYANGREVKVGDKIVGHDGFEGHVGNPVSGVVIETIAGADTCNATLVPTMGCNGGGFPITVTTKYCLHVEDVAPVNAPEQA